MNSEIARFGEDLAKNAALLSGLRDIGNHDNAKVVQYANAHGYQFTMNDIENLSGTDGELTDEQMETVTGGATTTFMVIGGKIGIYTNGSQTFVSF